MNASRTKRGSNATEFILTLPLLPIMASGIIDFSWYLVQYNAAVNAVREGARAGAAAPPDSTPDPVAQANAAAANAAAVYNLNETVTCVAETLTSQLAAYTCSVEFDFTPLVGFPGVTPPSNVSYTLTMMGQIQ